MQPTPSPNARIKILRFLRAALIVSLTVFVFYLDCVTGEKLTFYIFYIPSILLMAWFFGNRAGWFMVILASLFWVLAQWNVRYPEKMFFLYWNFGIRVVTFIVICWMTLKIRDKEKKLEKVSQELERSNKALEEFAYKAAHDLQTPLVTILGYAELIDEKFRNMQDQETKDFISRILKSCDRMKRFIHDLLEYSKVLRQATAVGSVDFNEIVKELIENFHFVINEKKAIITYDPLPSLPYNTNLIELVFQNLIGNALKYCEQAPRVHISAARKRTEWIFSVRDNGIGIPPEAKERVFKMFEKLTTRKKYPGSGIGLATCQTIVERCGGRIWVESEVGAGSTFYFTLPVA